MKIGVVTIGQSPRPDVIGEIERVLGEDVEIMEKGALDDFTLEDVQNIKIKEGQGVLVTRMRDGTEIRITHEVVNPIIQKRITELEAEGVEIILLVCTGRFPEFESKVLVVQPSNIIRGVSRAAIRTGRMASISPSMQQIGGSPREREEDGLVTYLDSASPYGPMEEVEELGERLAKQDVEFIVLNCMGFTNVHKRIIREKTGKPVLQSSAIVARTLKELIS